MTTTESTPRRRPARARTRPATSAGSAGGSCPRRSSPRSTSSTPRSARRWSTRRSRPSSTACSAPTPGARARSPSAPRFAAHAGGARVLLKREDLNHTGSHKINNVLGQALLTMRMGKTRVIAETGAGQHGVATATAAALFGLECVVYMGEEDTRRQALNVARMKLLGAEVVPVTAGSRTLKDAMNEAMRDWVTNVEHTHYLIGTVAGPPPFPEMVREFHRVIGVEAREQVLELTGRLPDAVVACVGGGSNAIGIFAAFLDDRDGRALGFEAGGDGVETGRHAARLTGGSRRRAARRSAPSSCRTRTARPSSRTRSARASTTRASAPSTRCCRDRARDLRAGHRRRGDGGLPPAVPHRGHHPGDRDRARPRRRDAPRASELGPDGVILVNLSGRGDKDVETASRWFGLLEGERAPEGRA